MTKPRMTKKDISEYAVGDSMFRYVAMGGVFEFKVIGVRRYGDQKETQSTQLEVESQSCNHGWKCQLLVAQDDYGRLVSIGMLNEDESEPQKYWHTQDEYHFYPRKVEAQQERLTLAVKNQQDRAKEAQRYLNKEQEKLREMKEMLELTNNGHIAKSKELNQ